MGVLSVFGQVHYKKTATIEVIIATSRLVTFSRLVTHFWCGHNERIFAKGECMLNIQCILKYESCY